MVFQGFARLRADMFDTVALARIIVIRFIFRMRLCAMAMWMSRRGIIRGLVPCASRRLMI